MDGWKISFLWGKPIFRGVLVSFREGIFVNNIANYCCVYFCCEKELGSFRTCFVIFLGSSNWNTQQCPRCLASTGIEKIRLIQRWETYLEVEEGWNWGWKTLSHGIHVWYIYLHENHKNQPNVGKYTIHGSYGHGKTPRFFTCFLRTKEWIDVVLFYIEQTTFGM